jgi:hypothetical protein
MWLMPVHRESAGGRIRKAASAAVLGLFLFCDFGSNSVAGQAKAPAAVFGQALAQVQPKTRIPIVLPSKLPAVTSPKDIKVSLGEVRDDGYFISLYFSAEGGQAAFAAGFSGSTRILSAQDLPNTRQVVISGGRVGMFRPVSCGGSCAPASLWWQQNSVMYQIQAQLKSDSSEADQERILVEMANSSVTVRNR